MPSANWPVYNHLAPGYTELSRDALLVANQVTDDDPLVLVLANVYSVQNTVMVREPDSPRPGSGRFTSVTILVTYDALGVMGPPGFFPGVGHLRYTVGDAVAAGYRFYLVNAEYDRLYPAEPAEPAEPGVADMLVDKAPVRARMVRTTGTQRPV